jgi:hypothetical protein
MSRLTKEIVHHSALSIGQGFGPIRLDYVPYLRSALLSLLLNANPEGASGDNVTRVIELLDSYGLSKDDFTESLREMQLTAEGDKNFTGKCSAIIAPIQYHLYGFIIDVFHIQISMS